MTRVAPDSASIASPLGTTANLSPVYRPHDEPAAQASIRGAALTSAASNWAGIEAHHFDYVSRGDFVGGTLYLPAANPGDSTSEGAHPLVLLTHATGRSAQSDELGFAAEWVRHRPGFAVATIDLPLHGHRQSPKLSERLIADLGSLQNDRPLDEDSFALVEEFCRQATSDLIRAVDALAGLPEIDASRIALMGLGAGALASAYAAAHAAAHESHLRACVLTYGCGQREIAALDPAAMLASREASMPLLIFRFESDPETHPNSVDRLFASASEPKQLIEFPGSPIGPAGLSKDATDQAFRFLREALA